MHPHASQLKQHCRHYLCYTTGQATAQTVAPHIDRDAPIDILVMFLRNVNERTVGCQSRSALPLRSIPRLAFLLTLYSVTQRKQHQPGLTLNDNTTHVPTAGSSAALTKSNHTPTRHPQAKGKIIRVQCHATLNDFQPQNSSKERNPMSLIIGERLWSVRWPVLSGCVGYRCSGDPVSVLPLLASPRRCILFAATQHRPQYLTTLFTTPVMQLN